MRNLYLMKQTTEDTKRHSLCDSKVITQDAIDKFEVMSDFHRPDDYGTPLNTKPFENPRYFLKTQSTTNYSNMVL